MRIQMGRIGIALLACAILVMLSESGASGLGSDSQGAPVKTKPVETAEMTSVQSGSKPAAASASTDEVPVAADYATETAAVPSSTRTTEADSSDATTQAQSDEPSDRIAPGRTGGAALGAEYETSAPAGSTPMPAMPPPAPPGDVRALYVTGWTAGSPRMNELIDTMQATGLNSVVIELKGEDGVVSYPTRVRLAQAIGAGSNKIRDLVALVDRLHAKGFYVIGRMVAFQDELLAEAYPEWSLRRDADGSVWRDAGGRAWVNPESLGVQSYLHTLALEAARAGVDEVQWDYVRFPSEGDLNGVTFTNDRPKAEVITSFLNDSREQLHKAGVAISADLFGFAAVATTDVGIGQQLEPVVDAVDYASLMVYPSHFSSGSMGIAIPDRAPGVTVYESMRRAVERTPVEKHRPWLQAFSLTSTYTAREVAAQIAALHALGIRSWILWNASNRYEGLIPSAAQVAESVVGMERRIAEGVLRNQGMGGFAPVVVDEPPVASVEPPAIQEPGTAAFDGPLDVAAPELILETPEIRVPARVEPAVGLLEPQLVR